MKIENLKVGQTIKNYKEICDTLNVEKCEGNSRKAQLKEFERYFSYTKKGHKFIINEIYEKPKEKIINYNLERYHGLVYHPLYKRWSGMKDRCYNKNCKQYNDYGGRGIKVCEEWKDDFMSFYNWAIDNGFSEELSIDRIDVDGNYCPDNCRWVTMKVQANNKRNNRKMKIKSRSLTIAQWSEATGLQYQKMKDIVDYTEKLENIIMNNGLWHLVEKEDK